MKELQVLEGPGEHHGVLAREGRSLLSKPLERLAPGSLIKELERIGERLRFEKLSGCGPETGWISANRAAETLSSKEDKKVATTAKATNFTGSTSLLARAEREVIERGAEKVLAGLTPGQDKAALIFAAVAQLYAGRVAAAVEAASKAYEDSSKDGSVCLVLASAKLANGEAREALGFASAALTAFKEVKDRQMEASALATSANARLMLNEVPPALYAAREALSIFREIGDVEGVSAAEYTLQDALKARDGPAKYLESVAAEQLAYQQTKRDQLAEAAIYQGLAEKQLTGIGSGPSEGEALKNSLAALRLYREAGDKQKEASALQTVASARLAARCSSPDGPQQAVQAAEEALSAIKLSGDKAMEAAAFATLATAQLALGRFDECLRAAEASQSLAKQVPGGHGQLLQATAAHILAGARLALALSGGAAGANSAAEALEARRLAAEAAELFRSAGAEASREALARQTEASATFALGNKSSEAALETARKAVGLFQVAGDVRGEASLLLDLAGLHLMRGEETSAAEALAASERSSALFLILDDKKHLGQARHATAQGHLFHGDLEMGTNVAMQAVVLAREIGDGLGEASAMRTAVSGFLARGRYAESLRMAKEVRTLFRKLGLKELEEAITVLCAQLEEILPHRTYGTKLYLQPKIEGERSSGDRSLSSQLTNCIMWTLPTSSMTYVLYCIELLKLVDDMKNTTSKTTVLVTTQGVMGRMTGEPVPCSILGVMGATVWAVCRTVRLESPKLRISTVDVPTGASPHEITECIRAAQLDAGSRGEISFVVDRKSLITGK